MMEEIYTTQHCIWLIDAVAHLASEAAIDSLFGRVTFVNEEFLHEHMDECYEPKIIEHLIKVINKLSEVRNPDEF